jgi:hypothetical protein
VPMKKIQFSKPLVLWQGGKQANPDELTQGQ